MQSLRVHQFHESAIMIQCFMCLPSKCYSEDDSTYAFAEIAQNLKVYDLRFFPLRFRVRKHSYLRLFLFLWYGSALKLFSVYLYFFVNLWGKNSPLEIQPSTSIICNIELSREQSDWHYWRNAYLQLSFPPTNSVSLQMDFALSRKHLSVPDGVLYNTSPWAHPL